MYASLEVDGTKSGTAENVRNLGENLINSGIKHGKDVSVLQESILVAGKGLPEVEKLRTTIESLRAAGKRSDLFGPRTNAALDAVLKANKLVIFTFSKWSNSAKPGYFTDYTRSVLQDNISKLGITRFAVSSTYRDAGSQAGTMYENYKSKGLAHELNLYAPEGDKVVRLIDSLSKSDKNYSKQEIIAKAKAKILEVGPHNVSHHSYDPFTEKYQAIDLPPLENFGKQDSSLAKKLVKLFRADPRINSSKIFVPWTSNAKDPAIHIEIPQPGYKGSN